MNAPPLPPAEGGERAAEGEGGDDEREAEAVGEGEQAPRPALDWLNDSDCTAVSMGPMQVFIRCRRPRRAAGRRPGPSPACDGCAARAG
jgi:hypothetical protein